MMVNKNVDIKICAQDAFLEYPSSNTLKIERLESHIVKNSTIINKMNLTPKTTEHKKNHDTCGNPGPGSG